MMLCLLVTNPLISVVVFLIWWLFIYLTVVYKVICEATFLSSWRVVLALSVSRHHHGSDNVHHHHWCLSLYATGVLRQSCRHLLVGKLPFCLPVCHRVRCCQLFHHSGGDEEAQEGKGHSHSVFSGHDCKSYICLTHRKSFPVIRSWLTSQPNSPLLPLSLQIPTSFNATQAMAFDGCFHDNEIDLTSFPEVSSTPNTERNTQSRNSNASAPTEGTRLHRKHPLKQNLSYIMSNSYMIDSYSRVIFPLAYLLFNIIYWSMYA